MVNGRGCFSDSSWPNCEVLSFMVGLSVGDAGEQVASFIAVAKRSLDVLLPVEQLSGAGDAATKATRI